MALKWEWVGSTARSCHPARIVATEKFDHSWYEGDAVVTVTLLEQAGRTTFTLAVQYASKEVRDGVLKSPATSGVEEGFNTLAALLPIMAKGDQAIGQARRP